MATKSRNTGGGATHKAIVAKILHHYPTAQTTGFMQALLTLPDADYVPDELSRTKGWRAYINMIPDAWMIDVPGRRVMVFEAVHGHDISTRKFGQLIDLAWALDEDYYNLFVIRVDMAGVRIYKPQDVYTAYNLEQARKGLRLTTNDVPDWARFTAEVTDTALEEFGPEPLVGLINRYAERHPDEFAILPSPSLPPEGGVL